jgi:hypothetical protein
MYFRRKQSQGRFYLQIVESHRTGDQVRQRVIATLGRLDELEASGQLDRLLRSGARFGVHVPSVSKVTLRKLRVFNDLAAAPWECPENGGMTTREVRWVGSIAAWGNVDAMGIAVDCDQR